LNRTRVTKLAVVKHVLTPLTTISLEAGRENERFDSAIRNIDYTRVLANLTFQQSALVSGTASLGLRYIYPWNPALPDDRMLTGNVNLTYRLLGSTRLSALGSRDIQHSIDAEQPLMTQTGIVYSLQQQIYGPFDVLGRFGHASLGFHDRIGGVVSDAKRREHVRTIGGGAGYRLGADKRIGFTLDYMKRTSTLVARRFHGMKYGISVTYDR
jgi:hypothetical protein